MSIAFTPSQPAISRDPNKRDLSVNTIHFKILEKGLRSDFREKTDRSMGIFTVLH